MKQRKTLACHVSIKTRCRLSWLVFIALGLHHQYRNVLAGYYRTISLDFQNATLKFSSLLKGVNIDFEREEIIDEIAVALSASGSMCLKTEFMFILLLHDFLQPWMLERMDRCGQSGRWVILVIVLLLQKRSFQALRYRFEGGDVPSKSMSCLLKKLQPYLTFL